MPSLHTLARGALVAAAIAFPSPAPAQDIGSTIVLPVLPDVPFVLPILSRYVFPADPRSGDVLTQRANNNRDSATYVPGLNSNTIGGFRRIGFMPASGSDDALGHHDDGSEIWTQPLYAGSALVGGVRQPVVLFASANNFVYAYSARIPFNLLWSRRLGEKYDGDPNSPTRDPLRICSPGRVGIESTPVVDIARNQIVVSFMTSDARHHVAALDVNDGHVIRDVPFAPPSPIADWDRMHRSRAGLLLADDVVYVAMAGLCEGNFKQHFFGSIFAFRASDLEPAGFFPVTTGVPVDGGGIWQASTGLAADSIGNLYVGTGNPAHALTADFKQIDPQLDQPNFTDTVLRLKVEKKKPFDSGHPSLSFTVADYFTPYRKIWLDWNDMDVAASGILLIPGSRYLVAAGKEGLLYTLNRADLGHFDRRQAQFDWRAADVDRYRTDPDIVFRAHLLHDDPARDFAHQKFQAGVNQYDVPSCGGSDASRTCFFGDFNHVTLTDWLTWPHIHGTPVFARFRDNAQFLFVWPEKDHLKRFSWNGTRFDPTPLESAEIAPPIPLPNGNRYPQPCRNNDCVNYTGSGMPGGMLAVNIDGDTGQGVLFAARARCAQDPDPPHANPPFPGFPCTDQRLGSLRAYDPFTLEEVWNDCGTGPSLPGDCNLGHTGTPDHTDDYYFAKFVPPTVAGGRVFLATAPPPSIPGKVIVYGK
jgi:outer membrane protein assembly factor BamB